MNLTMNYNLVFPRSGQRRNVQLPDEPSEMRGLPNLDVSGTKEPIRIATAKQETSETFQREN
ncbi:hypothetical protein LBMAG21_04220 [Armatimonadota bacterium]|nr:hypothetical protein LBMAG21_04220 [Armatimonadota bacterium]